MKYFEISHLNYLLTSPSFFNTNHIIFMDKILFTLLFLLGFSPMTHSQDTILKGIITDDNGTPLISATVSVGSNGTITDLDGNFNLPVAPGEHEMVVSYVGFDTKKEKITVQSGIENTVNITLSESINLLNTATVTSGKHEMALGEVTVSLDVIKPSLLESTNQTSLEGLLDKVPGINMIGDQANIRGGSGFSYGAGSRVLLLIDDMPIYQADAGFPQWEDVPIENVEQIEVVKGAASALYGSSALNGIINVRTAYAKSEPETTFSAFVTGFDDPKREELKWWDKDSRPYTTGGTVVHRRKIGKFDIVLGGRYHRSNSVQDSSMSRRGRITINTRYRITDRLSVGINSNFNKSKGSSFFYWRGYNDLYRPGAPVSRSSNLRYNIDPYVTYFDKANNRHKILTRFFNVDNETGTSDADQSNISQVYYGEYQFQRKMEKTGLVLTSGFVYNGTRVRAPLYGDTTFISNNLAGYLQLEKKLFDRLNLSAGFRYEDNTLIAPDTIVYELDQILLKVPGGTTKEAKPVFRLGASYALDPLTFLRASWGQGYRFPTIAEKYIYTLFGPTNIFPNPELQSETGWTAEIGLRKGFKISNFNGFADVSYFLSEYTDMMEFTFIPEGFAFQSQNIGDTRIRGYEISINGKGKLLGLETTLLTGFTHINPKFKEFGLDLPEESSGWNNAANSSVCPDNCKNVLKYRYRNTAKFDMESRYKKFSLGVAAFYTSFMENIDAVFEVFLPLQEFRQKNNNGDLVVGLRGAYRFTEKIKASLLANNITNREYSSRPGKLDAPRNFTLRMDYSF